MLLLCLKIFLIRIIDVSMGTVRTLYLVKGKRLISSLIGFIEVLIWFLVVREALSLENSSIYIAVAYAGGFAAGTYIGGSLAKRFITGKVGVQVFTSSNNLKMIDEIRNNGYALTAIEYKGIDEDEQRYMIYINIDKSKETKLRDLINKLDESAFIVVNETTYVENGYFK